MVIGNGLIAKAFVQYYEHDPNILIFASGVSNSSLDDEAAFFREEKLLLKTVRTRKKIFYFSSCSIYDPVLNQSPYVSHKIEMEKIVSSIEGNVVFRLPQVVGETDNPHTLTNFIFKKIMYGENFVVWRNAKRNLIDVKDVASIVRCMQRMNNFDRGIVNIAAPESISIHRIVHLFEKILDKKANYSLVDAGGGYSIETRVCQMAAKNIGIVFDDLYVNKVLDKYYANKVDTYSDGALY